MRLYNIPSLGWYTKALSSNLKPVTKVPPVKLLHSIGPRRDFTTTSRVCNSDVRVRFAPSPTGYLHLGGLRTVLYNYLFARSCKGRFLLRLEDTDQSRVVAGAAEALYKTLEWLGMVPDEGPVWGGDKGPYVQSQRLHLYQQHAQQLVDNGHAYRCFCTPFRIELLRKELAKRKEIYRYDRKCCELSQDQVAVLLSKDAPHCIRLKMRATPAFQDMVCGETNSKAELEGDPIILKSDGHATYHLACVVDDHLMGVTHVLRGIEWLVSTPKHLLLYECFGWDPPTFAHLPLLKNPGGGKLSKREDTMRVEFLKSAGYTPRALINLIVGGGISGRDHSVVYDLEELVQRFDLSAVKPQAVKVDADHMYNLSRLDLFRSLAEDGDQVRQQLQQLVQESYGASCGAACPEYLTRVLEWLPSRRICRLQELVESDYSYLWEAGDRVDLVEASDVGSREEMVSILQEVIGLLQAMPQSQYTKDSALASLKELQQRRDIKMKALMMLLRVALCNSVEGSPVGELLHLFGREESVMRLQRAIDLMQSG